MRIKTLSILIIFLFTSFGIISCLESDNENIELSTDNTIHSFVLDTIYGVNYKFSIDQNQRLIYNQDSVPLSADTIINKILIRSIQTATGYIETGDTVFNMNDSVNFLNSMDDPLEFKVYAQDNETRTYRIKVLRHKVDPDTLVWTKMANSFSNAQVTGEHKTVILNNNLYVYSGTDVYMSAVADGTNWTQTSSGLPVEAKISDMLVHNEALYVPLTSGEVYSSTDGTTWQDTPLSGNVVSLLTSFPDHISGIKSINGIDHFCNTTTDLTGWIEDTANLRAVPSNFPAENISTTVYRTNTGIYNAMLMGKSTYTDPEKAIPWSSNDGIVWAELETGTDNSAPYWEKPTVMHYNGELHAFGTGFEKFYTSVTGLVWNDAPKKVVFDPLMAGRKAYSTAVDANGFIWLVFINDATGIDEVWKGRINKLGFLRQ